MAVNVDPIQSNSKNILKLAVTAACAGLPATQVQAAIDEIIVTSTKREANLQDIPISVTVFTDEEIVRRIREAVEKKPAWSPRVEDARSAIA